MGELSRPRQQPQPKLKLHTFSRQRNVLRVSQTSISKVIGLIKLLSLASPSRHLDLNQKGVCDPALSIAAATLGLEIPVFLATRKKSMTMTTGNPINDAGKVKIMSK